MRSAVVTLALLILVITHALALENEQFTEQRFKALQAQDEVILVDIHADWCPTCARQKEVINAYRADNPDRPLHVLTVDFDSDKQWVRHFRAPRQSTLLLFVGEEQFWFSVAETREAIIYGELDRALDARKKR